MAARENIIFLHLPKAGGTTLRDIFRRKYHYLPEGAYHEVNRTKELISFQELSDSKRKNIKVLAGHFPYGVHDLLNGKFDYVTLLRDPINRVVSAYNYARSNPKHDYYSVIKENEYNLKDYVQHLALPWLRDGQCKFIAGVEDFKEDCTELIYNQAMDNIEKHFAMVGVLERYDESLLCLSQALNWSLPFYKRLNQTRDAGMKYEKPDPETLEQIRAANSFDCRLYEEVTHRLQSQIQQTAFFSFKLSLFKAGNALYGKL